MRCLRSISCVFEKKRGTSDWITAMRRSDGSLATDISSICSSWVDFYSSLFSAGSIDLFCAG